MCFIRLVFCINLYAIIYDTIVLPARPFVRRPDGHNLNTGWHNFKLIWSNFTHCVLIHKL